MGRKDACELGKNPKGSSFSILDESRGWQESQTQHAISLGWAAVSKEWGVTGLRNVLFGEWPMPVDLRTQYGRSTGIYSVPFIHQGAKEAWFH